jgi:cytochrome c oxidase assembly protein subunit 11
VYRARNLGKTAITGTAVYNVTPLEAGKYFYKTQCFCFGEQTLAPGEEVNMPVSFFVDPKILEDYDMRNIKTITLSYTFYRQDSAALEKAVENFINTSDNSASDKTLN